jgi:hypothetical protein
MIKAAIISALALSGVANAQDSYQRNCECASGISGREIDGTVQCWICSKESYPKITSDVQAAKAEAAAYGKCRSIPPMSPSEILIRIEVWSELRNKRQIENACWAPPDPKHYQAVDQINTIINNCFSNLPR